MATTFDLIRPIILDTYGHAAMQRDLALHLANQIDLFWVADENRERRIMTTCWNWYSGGDTAAGVAAEIEQVLRDR